MPVQRITFEVVNKGSFDIKLEVEYFYKGMTTTWVSNTIGQGENVMYAVPPRVLDPKFTVSKFSGEDIFQMTYASAKEMVVHCTKFTVFGSYFDPKFEESCSS